MLNLTNNRVQCDTLEFRGRLQYAAKRRAVTKIGMLTVWLFKDAWMHFHFDSTFSYPPKPSNAKRIQYAFSSDSQSVGWGGGGRVVVWWIIMAVLNRSIVPQTAPVCLSARHAPSLHQTQANRLIQAQHPNSYTNSTITHSSLDFTIEPVLVVDQCWRPTS